MTNCIYSEQNDCDNSTVKFRKIYNEDDIGEYMCEACYELECENMQYEIDTRETEKIQGVRLIMTSLF